MNFQRCSLHIKPWARSQWPTAGLPRYTPSRRYHVNAGAQYQPLEVLEDASVQAFREKSFLPERPILLPRRSFCDLPAYSRWFHHSPTQPNASHLNTEYLTQHGADALVPLELTQPQSLDSNKQGTDSELSFRQFHAPLSLFLGWITAAESRPQATRLYLAQCQLLDLPQSLRDDFPTPEIVAKSGKGDVYDTNVWIGYPPTYTPLHRDPNPNLFVQLAGRKVVRLLAPQDGQGVFSQVRAQLGQSSSREAAAFRGEEMMQGRERALLEQAVWGDMGPAGWVSLNTGFEAAVEAGDALFIPKGWWHSIKGTGESVTASVNWWFR
ncbi:hypothetical protein BJX61DRAFT_538738 [Aspergillus egyptiacus]|nr:hypothetical protein BJX61DRAFT_538738 [Aspergillus egyptiacus]